MQEWWTFQHVAQSYVYIAAHKSANSGQHYPSVYFRQHAMSLNLPLHPHYTHTHTHTLSLHPYEAKFRVRSNILALLFSPN